MTVKTYDLQRFCDGCPDMVSVSFDETRTGEQIAEFMEINELGPNELYFCSFSEYGTAEEFNDPAKAEWYVNLACLSGDGYSVGSFTYEQMDKFIAEENDSQAAELWRSFCDQYRK